MCQQVMVCEENVPVVFPNLDIAFDVDVVVQATVDEVFATAGRELDATHGNSAVFRNQRKRTFFLERLDYPPQETNARRCAKVFGEFIQLVGIEHIKAAREVSFRLSLFVEPMKIF